MQGAGAICASIRAGDVRAAGVSEQRPVQGAAGAGIRGRVLHRCLRHNVRCSGVNEGTVGEGGRTGKGVGVPPLNSWMQ